MICIALNRLILVSVMACCLATACLVVAFAAHAAPNDPHFSAKGSWGQPFNDQWALQNQRVYADIAPVRDVAEVIVAVIDTGLDYQHEDISQQQIWRNSAERKNGRDDDGNGFVDDLIGWNFVDNNNNPWDESGHGTHIAGVIAACTNNGLGIAGSNPNARLMPLKVANFTGQARSSSVAAAIYYAVDQGARIINLSLGGELVTQLEKDAATYAQERDVLLIVSAGNRGVRADQQGYPTLPGALVVGASDIDGTRAGFSNFGPNVALLAPGVDVLSLRAKDSDFIALSDPLDYVPEGAVVGEQKQYYRASGTSFSAALTSGIASRVLGLRPDLSSSALRNVLTQSAQDIAPPGIDQLSGYGALDYIAALTADANDSIEAQLLTAQFELKDNALWINILGTAKAAKFTGAELLVRAVQGSIAQPEVIQDDKRRKSKKKSKKNKKKRKNKNKDAEAGAPNPYEWQSVAKVAQPVDSEQIAHVALDALTKMTGGSTQWELRLVVRSEQGSNREAVMSLNMPAPQFAQDAPFGAAGE